MTNITLAETKDSTMATTKSTVTYNPDPDQQWQQKQYLKQQQQ
jgi:hypothetical protein